jgi:hypothetical protein
LLFTSPYSLENNGMRKGLHPESRTIISVRKSLSGPSKWCLNSSSRSGCVHRRVGLKFHCSSRVWGALEWFEIRSRHQYPGERRRESEVFVNTDKPSKHWWSQTNWNSKSFEIENAPIQWFEFVVWFAVWWSNSVYIEPSVDLSKTHERRWWPLEWAWTEKCLGWTLRFVKP